MQQGGVGYDFSTLRPRGARACTTGAIASGPVSFMRVWDSMCATILSTGARRGAMMATLRCDHPDIEEFIDAKRTPDALRHFNLSVLIPDEFMQAVRKDERWSLAFPERNLARNDSSVDIYHSWSGHPQPVTCRVWKTVRARELWTRLCNNAYDCAEPGVLFIDHLCFASASRLTSPADSESASPASLDGSLNRAPAKPAIQMLRLATESAISTLRRYRQAGARLAYGAYAWFVVLLFAAVAAAALMLVPTRWQAWRIAHIAAKWLVRALRIPFSVAGQANVDMTQSHIIVANHCSYVDSIFLAAVLPNPHIFVAKTELQSNLLLRACLRKLGTIFIERFEPLQSSAEVARPQQELAKGNSLVVFPEGTFTRITGLRSFHLGAFQTAVASGSPIVPVTLRGTRSVLRDGQWLLRRLPVSVVVGCPLPPPAEGDSFGAAVRLRDLARQEILSHCGEPDLP